MRVSSSAAFPFGAFEPGLGKKLARPGETGHHGSDGCHNKICNLLVGEIVKLTQYQHFPERLRYSLDESANHLNICTSHQLAFRRNLVNAGWDSGKIVDGSCFVHRLLVERQVSRRLPRLCPGQKTIPGDPQDPSASVTAGIAVEVGISPKKRLLDDVVSGCGLTGQISGEIIGCIEMG